MNFILKAFIRELDNFNITYSLEQVDDEKYLINIDNLPPKLNKALSKANFRQCTGRKSYYNERGEVYRVEDIIELINVSDKSTTDENGNTSLKLTLDKVTAHRKMIICSIAIRDYYRDHHNELMSKLFYK